MIRSRASPSRSPMRRRCTRATRRPSQTARPGPPRPATGKAVGRGTYAGGPGAASAPAALPLDVRDVKPIAVDLLGRDEPRPTRPRASDHLRRTPAPAGRRGEQLGVGELGTWPRRPSGSTHAAHDERVRRTRRVLPRRRRRPARSRPRQRAARIPAPEPGVPPRRSPAAGWPLHRPASAGPSADRRPGVRHVAPRVGAKQRRHPSHARQPTTAHSHHSKGLVDGFPRRVRGGQLVQPARDRSGHRRSSSRCHPPRRAVRPVSSSVGASVRT
jgi:hypothetical protein